MDITVVTCLYDIRSREKTDDDGTTRSIKDYIGLGKHMLQVRLPMIIYTDNEEVREEVLRVRQEYGLRDMTIVEWLPFEDTYFYKYMDSIAEMMTVFELHNWNKEKDTPLYVTLNNNKFDFLQRTMDKNPFGSSFYFWMDYGIQHCAQAPDEEWKEVWEKWPDFIRQETEKVHHLRIHTVMKPDDCDYKEYFRMIYHHIAGSLFGGHEKPMRDYIQLYIQEWENILYVEKWWQLDEAVMTIVVEKNPERFRLWYGDYDGLITNFIHSKRSWFLVFQTAQRFLDARNYTQSELVLSTLDDVMSTRESDNDFLRYLGMRICNDYYRWDSAFSVPLHKILMNAHRVESLTKWLPHQINNLRYYYTKLPEDIRKTHFHEIFEHIVPPMRFLVRWVFFDERNQAAIQKWRTLYRNEDGGQWLSIGDRCLSAIAIYENHMRRSSYPFDYVRVSPSQVMSLFRSQFKGFYEPTDNYTNKYGIFFEHHVNHPHDENLSRFERRIRRFYDLLENPSQRIAFLHTTESFLTQPQTEEEQRAYDKEIVGICRYISRNFPKLDFYILSLYINRQCTIPNDQLPDNMVVFTMETPVEYTNYKGDELPSKVAFSFRESVYEWLWCARAVAKNDFMLVEGSDQANFCSPLYS